MTLEGFRGCPSWFDDEMAPINALSLMFIGVLGVSWAEEWMKFLLILILNNVRFSDVYGLTLLQAIWNYVRSMT